MPMSRKMRDVMQHWDKLGHALLFFVMAAMLVVLLRATTPLKQIAVLLFVAFIAALDEFFQGFLPTRTPEWLDWIYGVIGSIAGQVVGFAAILVLDSFRPQEKVKQS